MYSEFDPKHSPSPAYVYRIFKDSNLKYSLRSDQFLVEKLARSNVPSPRTDHQYSLEKELFHHNPVQSIQLEPMIRNLNKTPYMITFTVIYTQVCIFY